MQRSIEQRFWEKVDKRGPNECWPWLAAIANRYGRFAVNKWTIVQAHRYSWELTHGRGMKGYGLHSCNNPLCVNPSHISDGTQSENILDAVKAGTHRNACKTHCINGHLLVGDRYCRQCKRMHNRNRPSRAGV